MLAAMRLGDADTWHQLFTDSTTRRQTEFQNLVISLMEDEKLDPVIVSSCMWLESGMPENQVQSVIDMVRYICPINTMNTATTLLPNIHSSLDC